MAKDYAKRNYNVKKPAKTRWWLHSVLAMIVIVFASITYWAYGNPISVVFHESHDTSTFFAKMKEMFQRKKTEPTQLAKAKPKIVNTEPKVQFDFYTDLPNIQVTLPAVNEIENKTVVKPAGTATRAIRYVIELGVFHDAASASERRLSLLFSGCDAEVVKIKTKEGEVYQVQHGPFINLAEAKQLQQQLQKKGIEGVIKNSL